MKSFWHGKRVLITGHTGFKGSWMSLWLNRLGAEVIGYSLEPPTEPNLYHLAKVSSVVRERRGDVRDLNSVNECIEQDRPEIVFHMAAQPLVRYSYADPVGTYSTNVMGTVNVLEAARRSNSVRVVLVITSDKCYENREVVWSYRESDPMGGYDPYSSSKGCVELVTSAYARSFFRADSRGAALASARAGNVIGGGDWATDRLVPDCFRALLDQTTIVIRNPSAVRPWQHVLEPLSGYILYAERLWERDNSLPGALNFGPYEIDIRSVADLADAVVSTWGTGRWQAHAAGQEHEASLLSLDSALARRKLGWRPRWGFREAVAMTVGWYREYASKAKMDRVTGAQIDAYECAAPGN